MIDFPSGVQTGKSLTPANVTWVDTRVLEAHDPDVPDVLPSKTSTTTRVPSGEIRGRQ